MAENREGAQGAPAAHASGQAGYLCARRRNCGLPGGGEAVGGALGDVGAGAANEPGPARADVHHAQVGGADSGAVCREAAVLVVGEPGHGSAARTFVIA